MIECGTVLTPEANLVENNLIFDFGFHNGDDTEFYLLKGFRVVAVEANPGLVKKGMERFKREIKEGLLVLVNNAIWDSYGTRNFFIHPTKDEWSSCFQELAESDGSKAEILSVESTSLELLCSQFGVPRYLKVDIEGCDLSVARQISLLRDKPKFVSFETSKRDYAGLFAFLYVSGYSSFQLVNQSRNTLRPLPSINGEGQPIHYKFGEYSSGYFGEDLPRDKRLSYEQALERYIKYKELKVADNQELGLGWLDLHARR